MLLVLELKNLISSVILKNDNTLKKDLGFSFKNTQKSQIEELK